MPGPWRCNGFRVYRGSGLIGFRVCRANRVYGLE